MLVQLQKLHSDCWPIHKHLSTQSRGCALNPNKNEAAMQESRITTKYLSSVTNETQMEIIAEKLFVLYCK